MQYKNFLIKNYKAVTDSTISLANRLIPIIGINESGKSSILEAITRFDFRNDEIVAQKNWVFFNRYKPTAIEDYCINATISLDRTEVDDLISSYGDEQGEHLVNFLSGATVISGKTEVVITRTLKKSDQSNKYLIGELGEELSERFARDLIQRSPRIIYFDNLLDRRLGSNVSFENLLANPDEPKNEDQRIMTLAFAKYNGYNILDIFREEDSSTRQTILNEVSKILTKEIIQDWKEMHLNADVLESLPHALEDISVSLATATNNHDLEIGIKETFVDPETQERTDSYIPLTERSSGFQWFFNFSIKKVFGSDGYSNIIYLIDEPGSYLHNTAQTVILRALRDISKGESIVLYTTHSEFLVDPEIVPTKNIILTKKVHLAICTYPIDQLGGCEKNQGPLSPVYFALRMKMPLQDLYDKSIVITEGVTDFYLWSSVTKRPPSLHFLPGTGAGSNETLISLSIGVSKKYLLILDGDDAGDRNHVRYLRLFGNTEQANWYQYLDSSQQKCRLEDLIHPDDIERLKQTLDCSDIKRAFGELYYLKQAKRDQVATEWLAGCNQTTIDNLNLTIDRINKIVSRKKIQLLTAS